MNKTYHFRPCPHCGQLLRSGSMATHEPVCVKRPEIYARLRSVLASEDGIRRTRRDMPPSVPTAGYLHPGEFVTVR